MIEYAVEELSKTPATEDTNAIKADVCEWVAELTGKQTIYQMIRLGQEVERRKGNPRPPLEYKREYHTRLWERIRDRVEGLRAGRLDPDSLLVPGSRGILEEVACRGVHCFLASGSDEAFVLQEARLLHIDSYFERIFGALDDYKSFSKGMVINRIVEENQLSGQALVTFGDGYVEIAETRAVGGIAVGVASREAERSGIDEWKRSRLIRAGADIIIPDFREHLALASLLFSSQGRGPCPTQLSTDHVFM